MIKIKVTGVAPAEAYNIIVDGKKKTKVRGNNQETTFNFKSGKSHTFQVKSGSGSSQVFKLMDDEKITKELNFETKWKYMFREGYFQEMSEKENAENVKGSSTGIITVGIIIVAIIMYIISLSGTQEDFKTRALNSIESEIMSGSDRIVRANYRGNDQSWIGKVVEFNTCGLENEEDGYGRYLVRCKFNYNPRVNGSIDLTKESIGDIYVVFMAGEGDNYYSSIGTGGTAYLSELKKSTCWGMESSYKLDC